MKLKIPKQETLFFGIMLTLITVCIILQIIIMCKSKPIETSYYGENEAICISPVKDTDLDNNAIYRLYECSGKIGVYDAKSEIIIDVLDIFVYSLPKVDRELLKSGIDIYSFAELSKIIDDFST